MSHGCNSCRNCGRFMVICSWQAAEVLRRRSKTRDSEISAESCMKLQAAEARLTELKSTVMALGREATVAMSSVESQQQEITAQRLFSMVLHAFLLSSLCMGAFVCTTLSAYDDLSASGTTIYSG